MSSIEKSLGIRLELIADFASATRTARENLGQIVTSIEDLKKAGSSFDIGGLNALGREVAGLNTRVEAAKRRVDDLGTGVTSAGRAASSAAKGFTEASSAVDGVAAAAGRARSEVLRLTTSLTGIDVVAVNRAGSAFAAWTREVHGTQTAITGLGQAIQELTGREHTIRMRVVYEPPTMNRALPAAGRQAALPPAYGSGYGPIPSRPSPPAFYAIGGATQFALPPGYSSGYGPIPQPASRPSRAIPLPGAPLALPGGTDPNFNARAWRANQRAQGTTSGSGPTIPVPPGGFGTPGPPWGQGPSRIGHSMLTAGNAIQGAGWAGVVNAAMIGAVMVPLVKQITDLEDLFRRTYEALRSGGATEQNAQKISQGIANVARTTKGADYRDTASAGYNFFSSLPATAHFNLNDPAQQKMLLDAYRQIVKMQVAGSSSTHPISMETATLDTLATATNLGFDMSTPAKAVAAIKKTTDLLINLKNRTSTEVDLAATSFRNIGPIAANQGISPEEVVGLVAAEAEGKIRGGPAGNNLKRILSRQAITPKKLAQMQKIVAATGGNVSMYDANGNVRNMFDFITDIGAYEKKYHLPARERAIIEGQLSGLYAGPGLGEIVRFGQQIGGAEGFKKFAHDIYTQPPAGSLPGETPTDTAHRQRTQGNVKSEAKTTDAAFLNEARKTFKLLEPDLIKVLHAVDGIIAAFDKLPDPVKKGAVELMGLVTIASGAAGVAGVLIGNFVKFGGAIFTLAGFVANAAQKLMMFGGTLGTIARFGLAVVAGLNPVTLVVGGIALAIAGLALAWAKDWGGIREKTAAAVSWIKAEIPKIPEQIGEMVGRSAVFLGQMAIKWDTFWRDFPRNALNAITNTVAFLVNSAPKWTAAGIKMLQSFGEGIVHAIPQVASTIVTAVKNTGGFLAKLAGDALEAGQTVLKQFADGVEKGANAQKPRVQAALKKTVADQLPHSPPADPSSPLHGLEAAGQATADMYIKGLIDSLVGGGAKAHKKALKKAVNDVIVQTRGEAVNEIVKTAQAMEAALARAGAPLEKRMIDLMTAHGAVRIQGDPRAFSAAVSQNRKHKTNYEQQAHDYLRSILDASMGPQDDPGFKAWFAKYSHGHWDPVDNQGLSGGYRLYRAYQLGLTPDKAGHLPDYGPNHEPLKTYLDPNRVTNGIDNGTGYQVAPPNYTGPLTAQVIKNASRYFYAHTATRPGGPGGWDDVPAGQFAPALTPPKGYKIPADPAFRYIHALGLSEQTLPAIIAHLKQLEKKAYNELDAHAVSQIDHMIAVIESAAKKADARKKKALENLMRPFFGDPTTRDKGIVGKLGNDKTAEDDLFAKFSSTASKYEEKISNYISIRKNREAPTASELKRELTLEINEREALITVLQEEERRRRTLSDDVLHLKLLMDNLNDSDKKQHALKVKLQPVLAQYQSDLRDVNDQMTYQQGVVQQVNAKVGDYEKAISKAATATTGWQKALSDAFNAGIRSAMRAGSTTFGNELDSMLQRALGAHTKKGSIFQKMIADFLGTFLKTLLGGIVEKILKSMEDSFTGVIGKIFGGKSTGGGLLGAIFGGGVTATSSTGAGKPIPVSLQPQNGGATDLGQTIADATAQTATNAPSSAVDKMPSSSSSVTIPGGTTADPTSTQKAVTQISQGAKKVQQVIKAAAGAYAAYEGIQQGGIMGAMETYAGVSSMFSGGAAAAGGAGPYVAGAAAIFSLLQHHDNPQMMPDKYQPGFGQFVENVNGGTATIGGQVYSADPQYNQSAGNKSLADQLAAFVANPAAMQGLTDQQKAIVNQLKALAGGNPDGLSISSERQDTFTLASGQKINVEQYEALINQGQALMNSQQGALQQQQQNADSLAASFTSLVLGGPAGFLGIPYLLGGGTGVGGGAAVGDGRSMLPGRRRMIGGGDSGGSTSAPVVNIHILENANVNGVEDINSAIDQALPRITAAVQRKNYQNGRLYGNYVSAVGM